MLICIYIYINIYRYIYILRLNLSRFPPNTRVPIIPSLQIRGKPSPFTYVLYYDIRVYHQHHRFQSSGWTAHQRVTGNIYTGYERKPSGSGGGAIR